MTMIISYTKSSYWPNHTRHNDSLPVTNQLLLCKRTLEENPDRLVCINGLIKRNWKGGSFDLEPVQLMLA